MKITHLVIVLLVFTTVVPVTTSYTEQLWSPQISIEDTQLQYQISSSLIDELQSKDSETEILLQFDDELTNDELNQARQLGIRFHERDNSPIHVGSVYLASIRDQSVLDKSALNLGLSQVSSTKKQFFTSLDSAVDSLNASDVWTNLSKDGLPIDGSGVTVAVIDTGINWQHPCFWRQSSEELDVILHEGDFYVDIDGDSSVDSGEGPITSVLGQTLQNFSYGVDYLFIDVDDDGSFSYAAGDRWIGGVDANHNGKILLPIENVVLFGESKVSILYDQENGDVYIRGVNLTTDALSVRDYHGHGTHVASTIAGGQVGFTARAGIAPNADLIIVRSLLSSGDIVDAIHFAIANEADVINMSFSSYLGFLDGTDIEDLVITEAFIQHGTICTIAAGNLGGKSKHSSFNVGTGTSVDVALTVGSPPAYSFLNILWNSKDKDERIILTTPLGDSIEIGPFNDIEGSAFRVSTDELVANVFADVSYRNTCRIIVQTTEERVMTAGDWIISVENPTGPDIYSDVYVWDNEWAYNGLRVTSHVDNSRTISSPGTSDFGIAVTAYSETSDSVSFTSSRGPRIDGIPKPEVTAPGVSITAASLSLSSIWSTRSGTSMASPQVAGILALIKSASGGEEPWLDYSALIQGAGGPNRHNEIASSTMGYGLCDALWSVHHVLDHTFTNETTLADWTGIGDVASDPSEPLISSELDMQSVKVLQQLTHDYFAIQFSGLPDFNTSDVLEIKWDTDDSMTTGLNGIDTIVNLTENFGAMYSWSGSEFTIMEQNATWWRSGKTIFFDVPLDDNSTRGILTISTYNSTHVVDSIESIHLTNQWRPLILSLSTTTPFSTAFDVLVSIRDQDTEVDGLTIDWLSFDGDYNEIDSSSVTGVLVTTIRIDYTENSGLIGILLEVSDEESTLYYPPVIISEGLSIDQTIITAEIHEDVVPVGLLSPSTITGAVEIDGFLLIDKLYLAFESQYGFWVNFTLSGVNGNYPISVALSGFSAGEYDISVVAVNLIGKVTTRYIKTIEVVDDNSLLILGGIGLSAIIVIVFIVPRLRNRSKE